MNIQVLVATMKQPKGDYSLLNKMNMQTDAIVCNQCERNEFEEFIWKGHNIQWLSFAESGVGLNRNNALMRATGDIVLFADDDMVYKDGFPNLVREAFKVHSIADLIAFNIGDPTQTRKIIPKVEKVGRHNYLRYGTTRIAVKLSPVKQNGIYFNQCFGGGTEHCHGEDNLFLTACLDKGLKIYAVPVVIAELTEERESSWNTGYDEKYLRDQGVLYKTISRRWWKLLCLQDAIRRRYSYPVGWKKAYKIMVGKM